MYSTPQAMNGIPEELEPTPEWIKFHHPGGAGRPTPTSKQLEAGNTISELKDLSDFVISFVSRFEFANLIGR
jgi:hypothetical protein